MKNLSIQLPDEMHEKLKKEAEKRGFSIAGYTKNLYLKSFSGEDSASFLELKKHILELKKFERYHRNTVKMLMENKEWSQHIAEKFDHDNFEETKEKVYKNTDKEWSLFKQYMSTD